jgi:uncharacterized protein YajQ (UPF0234 family)
MTDDELKKAEENIRSGWAGRVNVRELLNYIYQLKKELEARYDIRIQK